MGAPIEARLRNKVGYMAVVGSFPFNSFLSGVLSCFGTAVLAVCLRIQVNKENKEFKVQENMSTESSIVYKQIQEILGCYFSGMPLSANWYCLERSYWVKFKKSLHYQSLGVRNLDELLDKMGDMVVVFEDLKKKMKYVMSARMVETRRNRYLKPHVQELFSRHCGEIKFDSFEDFYEEHWGLKLNYHFYGLTKLDHLCEALKDILEVDFDCSGVKVIKAVKCYNLRKRKYWM